MVMLSPVFHAKSHPGYLTLGAADIAPLRTPYTFTIQLNVEGLGLLEYPNCWGPARQCGYATEKEAWNAREILLIDSTRKVYVVLKNADFTEGRGPMVLHEVFASLAEAEIYVASQDGIYGSQQHRYLRYGVNMHGDLYGSVAWNGYEIRTMPVR